MVALQIQVIKHNTFSVKTIYHLEVVKIVRRDNSTILSVIYAYQKDHVSVNTKHYLRIYIFTVNFIGFIPICFSCSL